MDLRGRLHNRFFRTRTRRRSLLATVAVTSVVTAGLVSGMTAGADTTNGEQITWADVQCIATAFGQPIVQAQDVAVQVVVPDTAATSSAYSATIPGGTATLPSSGGGFQISGFKNVSQTYLFRSSAGSPQITSAVANGVATNNGNPVTYNVTPTNEGASAAASTATHTIGNGGTNTYTTSTPHGLAVNQLVDVTGFGRPLWNVSAMLVASVPSATQFTIKGQPLKLASASWSGGVWTYHTVARLSLKVGDTVTIDGASPSRYNGTKVVASLPDDHTFTSTTTPGTTDPGLMSFAGTVDTLPNPGAIGTPLGSVRTLTTLQLNTPAASPGPLTTPDVTINMTAPAANSTVTTYGAGVAVTATLIGPGDTPTQCIIPHADPQTDGISAVVVGTGGPTTTSYPTCRPPDVCATTTTTLPPAPAITSIAPTSGTTAGGTSVTITGTNLAGTTAVTFGGTSATIVGTPTATTVTATSPAHAAGLVDVSVTTPGGTNPNTASDDYTYVAGPSVTSVTPTSGPAAGGTSVTIAGTNLTGATAVTFGGTAATTFTVNNANQITATAPAHAAGTVDVLVTTPTGTSANTAGDDYTYVAAPTVTSVTPSSGPTGGGTSVTIAGTGFTGATAVSFGGTPAAAFVVDNGGQITATAPAHAAGTVNVTVTTPGGTSANTAGDDYAFVAAPTVTSVTPNSGPTGGGTSVTIAGTNLTGASAVSFGGTAATTFTVDNANQITATAPAHAAGPVDVTVTTVGGTSANTAGDDYTYTGVVSSCGSACIVVGDKTILETDALTKTILFPVTLSQPATQQVTVQYTIVDGSATGGPKLLPGVDYKSKTGTVTFKPGLNSGITSITKTIAVTVWADTGVEPDENLSVVLSAPTGGYTIGAGTGTGTCGSTAGCATGTIVNDDDGVAGFTLGVGDGSIFSARSGKQSLKLPVSLSGKATTNVTVDYVVVPGSATHSLKVTDGGDYGGKTSGTLTFTPGQTLKQIVSPIYADATPEADQSYTVVLSNVNGNGTGVTIIRVTGTGTILGLN